MCASDFRSGVSNATPHDGLLFAFAFSCQQRRAARKREQVRSTKKKKDPRRALPRCWRPVLRLDQDHCLRQKKLKVLSSGTADDVDGWYRWVLPPELAGTNSRNPPVFDGKTAKENSFPLNQSVGTEIMNRGWSETMAKDWYRKPTSPPKGSKPLVNQGLKWLINMIGDSGSHFGTCWAKTRSRLWQFLIYHSHSCFQVLRWLPSKFHADYTYHNDPDKLTKLLHFVSR